MFLCEQCHPKKCEYAWLDGAFGRSFGPCEGCGVTEACRDCHGKLPIEKVVRVVLEQEEQGV